MLENIKKMAPPGNLRSNLREAMVSNNVAALESIFSTHEPKNFLPLLSKQYEESKLRNIPLSRQTQSLIEYTLINSQFVKNKREVQENNSLTSFESIKHQLDFACDMIKEFLDKYKVAELNVDTEFLFRLRYIGQHITVLKRRMDFSYEYIPWEEMEFCLVMYMNIITCPENTDFTYKMILHNKRILQHLYNFNSNLVKVQEIFTENHLKQRRIPVAPCENCEDLQEDFLLLKDMHSLDRINFYIGHALNVDIDRNDTMSLIVIERALQVMGEYIKNTSESPNFSEDLYKSFQKAAPRNLKDTIWRVRNMLSHAFSLSRKLQVESSKEFFKKIQLDLKKIQNEVTYILYKRKIDVLKIFLLRINYFNTIQEVKELFQLINGEEFEKMKQQKLIELEEFSKVDQLVSSFCQIMLDESSEYISAVNEIIEMMKSHKSKSTDIGFNYAKLINIISTLISCQNSMDNLKKGVRTMLGLLSKYEPQNLYDGIFKKIYLIYESFKRKKQENYQNLISDDDKVIATGKILTEIYNYVKWKMRRIDWIEKMENELAPKDELNEKARNLLQMVLDKLDSTESADKINEQITKAQEHHYAYLKLKHSLEDSEAFKASVNSLNINLETRNTLLNYYAKKNQRKLLLKLDKIPDAYGAFLKKLGDIFPLSKHRANIKNFYEKLPLEKKLQAEISAAIDEYIKETIEHFYSQRLNLLNKCLTVSMDEAGSISLEMIMLDLLELLHNVDQLGNNIMLPVLDMPIITGKQLRNYLAHGNILTDFLPYDPRISLTVHAKVLLEIGKDILKESDSIFGYTSKFTYNEYFERSLRLITNQTMLFTQTEKGNVEVVKQLLAEEIADIAGRSHNGWSVLCYAIIGADLNMLVELLKLYGSVSQEEAFTMAKLAISMNKIEHIEFLLKNNYLNVNELCNGQSLLNVALSYHQDNVAYFLINQGAVLNTIEPTGQTTLHYAAEIGATGIIKLIVDQHPDLVKKKTHLNLTPLHLSAKNGHIDSLNILLDAGADIAQREYLTPFEIAAEYGRVDIITCFLDRFSFDFNGEIVMDALKLASEIGHCNVLEVIFSKNNDLVLKKSQMEKMFLFGALFGQEGILKWLMSKSVVATDYAVKNALHLASVSGHVNIVDLLLNNKVDPNTIDNNNWTAAHNAALNGQVDIVKRLSASGRMLELKDKQGKTALHLAAENGYGEIVCLFIEAGFDLGALTNEGHTALHLAAENGHYHLVTMLINAYQININSKNKNNETALMSACETGQTSIVELLLQLGADTDVQSFDKGRSALTIAASHGYKDIMQQLIKKGADLEIREKNGWTALHWVVQNGYEDIFNIIIEKGVHEIQTYPPLHTAVRNGHINIAEKLIRKGARVDTFVKELLPLRIAAHFGYEDIVELLISHGAKVDDTGNDSVTPLHAASWNGHVKVVELLLWHDAEVNLTTVEEWTALHFAVKFGFRDIVRILMRAHADIYIENNIGANAFHIACEVGHEEIVSAFLSNYGVNANNQSRRCGASGSHWAAANSHVDVLNTLICNGADVRIRATDGSTPLHWAAHNSCSATVIRILVENGCVVNSQDGKGSTPLHLAVVNGNEDIVGELLKLGANVNVENKKITPLHLAVGLGRENIVKQLISVGADVNKISIYEKTCLHIAIEKGYEEIASILVDNGADPSLIDVYGKLPFDYA